MPNPPWESSSEMPKRNIVWLIVGAVIAVLLWKVPETRIRRDTIYSKFSPLLDVHVQVAKHHVEKVDDQDLLRGAIDGMLSRIDPYSAYFTEEEYKEFEKRTQGRFSGIGVHVAITPGHGLVVVSPIEGSPAFRAGLRTNDLITHVDGTRTIGLSLDKCVRMISGEPDTQVQLTIQRSGVEDPFDVTIVRGMVNVPSVRGWARTADFTWDYLIDPEMRIGYVRILSFEGRTAEDFREIVDDLYNQHQIRGLILDVRDNPGGLLSEVVEIADRFITEGLIVSTKGREAPPVPYRANAQNAYPRRPMAILVNAGSASASEILAGALRDHGRAVVVGERTFGKGSVQKILQVENNHGLIKLTTEYYYLPNGERIHGKGIAPDHIIDLTPDERTRLLESWMAVYSATRLPTTTQAATSSAPATEPAEERFEITLDRQLMEALNVVRAQIETPQEPVPGVNP